MPSLRGTVRAVLGAGQKVVSGLATGAKNLHQMIVPTKKPRLIEAYWEGDRAPPPAGASGPRP